MLGVKIVFKESEKPFVEELISKEPIGQFSAWLEEAKKCQGLESNNVLLSTANKKGAPSARIVLLKNFGPDGFTFFTNYGSRKGRELEENPQAALTFYWPQLNRQVRIEGKVTKVSESESYECFNSRPVEQRISSIISPQSQVVSNRSWLVEASKKQCASGDLSKPATWGGYCLYPEEVEFWQGQQNRLHDRIVYVRNEGKWKIQRLAP